MEENIKFYYFCRMKTIEEAHLTRPELNNLFGSDSIPSVEVLKEWEKEFKTINFRLSICPYNQLKTGVKYSNLKFFLNEENNETQRTQFYALCRHQLNVEITKIATELRIIFGAKTPTFGVLNTWILKNFKEPNEIVEPENVKPLLIQLNLNECPTNIQNGLKNPNNCQSNKEKRLLSESDGSCLNYSKKSRHYFENEKENKYPNLRSCESELCDLKHEIRKLKSENRKFRDYERDYQKMRQENKDIKISKSQLELNLKEANLLIDKNESNFDKLKQENESQKRALRDLYTLLNSNTSTIEKLNSEIKKQKELQIFYHKKVNDQMLRIIELEGQLEINNLDIIELNSSEYNINKLKEKCNYLVKKLEQAYDLKILADVKCMELAKESKSNFENLNELLNSFSLELEQSTNSQATKLKWEDINFPIQLNSLRSLLGTFKQTNETLKSQIVSLKNEIKTNGFHQQEEIKKLNDLNHKLTAEKNDAKYLLDKYRNAGIIINRRT